MPNNPNFSIEKVYSVYKKVKILKVQEKFSSALNLLEGILRSSKKKYYCECSKITSKILSICNYLFCNSSSKIQIMRRSEAAISTYLNLSSKHKLGVSEKLVRKMLISFNNCSCFHRLSGNYSLSFDYFQKALFLVKNSNFTEGPSFEMLSKVHLNLSSIFLQLKNFEDSINSSEQSLKALQKAILTRKCESTSEDQEKHQDTILGYVISFYCISLGQSGKKQSLKAREAISKAVDVGKNFFDLKNEVYEMVLNKYKDLETPSNNSELGRIKSVFHLALDQPFSSIKFLDPVKSQVAQSERKVPGRYYTRSQLAIKQKFLENHKNLNFISADEYFFQEISKSINIHSDLKHLKTTDSSDSKGWIRQENIEKRIISELRLKKKFRNTSLTSPIPTIHDKLKRLKLENDGQKNQVQNIVNSNQFKIIISRICPGVKRENFATQKLFFKPKSMKKDSIDPEDHLEVKKITDPERRMSVYQNTKDEIEHFMDSINKEIQMMHTERDTSKMTSPSVCGSVKSLKDSFLCKSANKTGKSSENHLGLLKKAINISLRPRRKQIQRKPSKMQNLQV